MAEGKLAQKSPTKLSNVVMLLICAAMASGCSSPQKSVFQVDGPKLPATVGLFLGPGLSALRDEEKVLPGTYNGLKRKELYQHIKSALVEALGTGFDRVVDVATPPPYSGEAASELDGVICVDLQSAKFSIPRLRFMSFKSHIVLGVSVYDRDGSCLLESQHAGVGSQTLVFGYVEFTAKSAFANTTETAARQCAESILTDAYHAISKRIAAVAEQSYTP